MRTDLPSEFDAIFDDNFRRVVTGLLDLEVKIGAVRQAEVNLPDQSVIAAMPRLILMTIV